jgi:pimeloyl-ACP methyl ester carboxylesterase
MRPEEARRWIDEAEQRFGDPNYFRERAGAWFPSIAEDEEAVERMHRIWLLTSSPGAQAAFRRMNMEIDVRHVLPTIRVPTLVLQRGLGDIRSPIGRRYVAKQIPGARYVEIDGADIVPWLGDADAVTEAVEGFFANLTDRVDGDDGVDVILATVLFTDIVDSTAKRSS